MSVEASHGGEAGRAGRALADMMRENFIMGASSCVEYCMAGGGTPQHRNVSGRERSVKSKQGRRAELKRGSRREGGFVVPAKASPVREFGNSQCP